jgi:Ca2+-binding RTX toxin-like protein
VTATTPAGLLASARAADPSGPLLTFYDDATGELFYDADGTGGLAQVQFAKMAAGLGLTAAHFELLT